MSLPTQQERGPPYAPWYIYYLPGDAPRTPSGDDLAQTWADGFAGDEPTIGAGDSADFPFKFYPDKRARPEMGTTHEDHRDRYRTLLSLAEDARYSLREVKGRRPIFTDDSEASEPSPLVGLRPAYETSFPAIWALVDGAETATRLPDELCEATLSVTVLATFAEYGPADLQTLLGERSFTGI